MKMTPGVRRGALVVALAGTLLATYWVSQDTDTQRANAAPSRDTEEPRFEPVADNGKRNGAAPKSETNQLDLNKLKRGSAQKPADAFSARTWEPPPKKLTAKEIAAQKAAAPPPQAPAVPFTYVGMLGEGDETTVFLAQGEDRNIAAKAGDVIDGTYRVDAITETAIQLTYLPMSQAQSLPIGGATQ